MTTSINIRNATPEDLPLINRVIEEAVMGWSLPERVKRLSLPSYRYNEYDLMHLQMVVAEEASGEIIGVAAWEVADTHDTLDNEEGLLLHGLYVAPAQQHQGIGSMLFTEAEKAVRQQNRKGLLVKAQEEAVAFFLGQGMQTLPVEDERRHYANRLWKSQA